MHANAAPRERPRERVECLAHTARPIPPVLSSRRFLMEKARFAYVTYICTSPGKVWNALLDSEVVRQYWGRHQNVSDWKPGSSWEHQDYDDPSKVDIVGKVVENAPPRKLVLTWA